METTVISGFLLNSAGWWFVLARLLCLLNTIHSEMGKQLDLSGCIIALLVCSLDNGHLSLFLTWKVYMLMKATRYC